MNRHTRITDRVRDKNNKIYFKEYVTVCTKNLIKEYEKLRRLSIEKELGKLNDQLKWSFQERICKFQNDLHANEQTKHIQLNLATYNRTFEAPQCTELNQFLEDKHIPLF